jgi:hypothetical protein
VENLVEMSDQYLYQAKNSGRDKVIGGPFAPESGVNNNKKVE